MFKNAFEVYSNQVFFKRNPSFKEALKKIIANKKDCLFIEVKDLKLFEFRVLLHELYLNHNIVGVKVTFNPEDYRKNKEAIDYNHYLLTKMLEARRPKIQMKKLTNF